jgi:hypothetical protein
MKKTNSPYDHQWQQLRKRYLRAFPMCQVKGCDKKAQHVDHILTVRAAPHRRLDITNLEGLCHQHHSVLTAVYDGGRVVPYACDEQGYPIDGGHPWGAATGKEAIRIVNATHDMSPMDRAKAKRQAVLGRT